MRVKALGWCAVGCVLVAGAPRGEAAPHFQDLGFLLGDNRSVATAISANGAVVVGQSFSGNPAASFRWTSAGGMQDLGTLPGGNDQSAATVVSADGSVIGGYATTFSP